MVLKEKSLGEGRANKHLAVAYFIYNNPRAPQDSERRMMILILIDEEGKLTGLNGAHPGLLIPLM